MTMQNNKTRAVIVAGRRTPFVKAFGPFLKLDTIGLGNEVVKGLLAATNVDHNEIDAVIWGSVILPTGAPNVAREIVLDLDLPATIQGVTVTRACASGLQAITDAVALIERGEAQVVIAGGSESTSNVSITLPPEVVHAVAPLALGKGVGPKQIAGVIKDLWPFNNILPRKPEIAERSTGEVMGESAEKMAGINGITREEQDKLALASHQKADKAIKDGLFKDEVLSITTPDGKTVDKDGFVRGNSTLEKLASLKPVFAENGTLTAGNSSPLTDGGAAVLLMSEEKAKELGYEPLATVESWSYVGVDPRDQLLIGPAIAMPEAVERAGKKWKDMDLVDIHEAFAAQVLSVTKMLESDSWAKERLGKKKAVAKIDWDSFNVHGGSLAFGHPFAATGPRMVTTMANELQRSGKNYAVLGICAAGGLGAAAVLKRYEPAEA